MIRDLILIFVVATTTAVTGAIYRSRKNNK